MIAKEAEEARAKAEAAIRATSGNLEAREEAKRRLRKPRSWNGRPAKQTRPQILTRIAHGLGMRYSGRGKAAQTWAYDRNTAAFLALVIDMAREQVRAGKRELPVLGFGTRRWLGDGNNPYKDGRRHTAVVLL